MDKHELFDVWAPRGSVWSAWAKPVLFAHLPRTLPVVEPPAPPDTDALDLLESRHEGLPVVQPPPPPDLSWVPPGPERWAVVVDLPGVEAVRLGAALAERGYRPVPVFNACPPPAGTLAVIDVESTLAALVYYARRLGERVLPEDAPPAFLIDANRQRPLQPVQPKLFDNRSVLFVTDFPSANFLAAQHIERAVLVSEQPGRIDQDLAYVLRTWQRAGISLSMKRVTDPGPLQPLAIGDGWLLFDFLHRLTSALVLRHNPLGGYGWFVPEAASG